VRLITCEVPLPTTDVRPDPPAVPAATSPAAPPVGTPTEQPPNPSPMPPAAPAATTSSVGSPIETRPRPSPSTSAPTTPKRSRHDTAPTPTPPSPIATAILHHAHLLGATVAMEWGQDEHSPALTARGCVHGLSTDEDGSPLFVVAFCSVDDPYAPPPPAPMTYTYPLDQILEATAYALTNPTYGWSAWVLPPDETAETSPGISGLVSTFPSLTIDPSHAGPADDHPCDRGLAVDPPPRAAPSDDHLRGHGLAVDPPPHAAPSDDHLRGRGLAVDPPPHAAPPAPSGGHMTYTPAPTQAPPHHGAQDEYPPMGDAEEANADDYNVLFEILGPNWDDNDPDEPEQHPGAEAPDPKPAQPRLDPLPTLDTLVSPDHRTRLGSPLLSYPATSRADSKSSPSSRAVPTPPPTPLAPPGETPPQPSPPHPRPSRGQTPPPTTAFGTSPHVRPPMQGVFLPGTTRS
jgi:hypothetical protein